MSEWWYSSHVRQAGPSIESSNDPGTVYIQLRSGDGTRETWFRAADLTKQNLLATALAAIMSGFPVNAEVASSKEYDLLLRLYLIRQD